MPIYEYRCDDCEQIFEEWQKTYEDKVLGCPTCGGVTRRVMSNSAFVLKGTGWYTTDYCNRGSSKTEAKSEAAGGTKPAEASSASSGSTAGTATSGGAGDAKAANA